MEILIAGVLLLAAVLGIFYLKDRLEAPWLTRFAYHELTMRLVVVAMALIFFGGIMTIGSFFK
jgi:hypothetical protein